MLREGDELFVADAAEAWLLATCTSREGSNVSAKRADGREVTLPQSQTHPADAQAIGGAADLTAIDALNEACAPRHARACQRLPHGVNRAVRASARSGPPAPCAQATVLHTLRVRHSGREVYSCVADVVISVNPFEPELLSSESFSTDVMRSYALAPGASTPHRAPCAPLVPARCAAAAASRG